mgnify:CR=1 FL=1
MPSKHTTKETYRRENSPRVGGDDSTQNTKEYDKLVRRTKKVLKKYCERIKEVSGVNKALME